MLDQVEKAQRAAIAEKIMAIPALKAEQVGYVCPAEDDADGHMEMMGGEFCGNATRAYGMYIARQKGGLSSVKLRVSGCDHIVTAQVDLEAGTARAEMPCPRSVQRITANGHEGTLVDLTGIAHLVVEGVKPSEEFFRAVEPVFSQMCIRDRDGLAQILGHRQDEHVRRRGADVAIQKALLAEDIEQARHADRNADAGELAVSIVPVSYTHLVMFFGHSAFLVCKIRKIRLPLDNLRQV